MGKTGSGERERDEDKENAQLARLAALVAGDMKAVAKDKLARVQVALAVVEEARQKAEAKAARLEVERTSLLLEIKAAKDKMSSLHSQAGKDKEAMDKDYQKALELIFTFGYRCCMLKHYICGDQPKVPDGMPDSFDPLPLEFFMNPRCPPVQAPTEATATKAEQSKTTKKAKDPKMSAPAEDFAGTS